MTDKTTETDVFEQLKKKALSFRDKRDWRQFHSPKNLAEGLSIEAAELLENFLWKTTEQSRQLNAKELARVKVMGGTCWTTPSFADGRIYCRNDQGSVVCLDVK